MDQIANAPSSYANEYDMVPRWGVLHCTRDILSNCYAGAVFVRMGASGHMLNQHYLDPMFPTPSRSDQRQPTDTEDASPVSADSFLDQKVSVDSDMLLKRRNTQRKAAGILRSESGGLEFGDGELVHSHCDSNGRPNGGGALAGGDQTMCFGRTDSGKLLGEEARGKTVRELSRLWRYQGGKSPE